jgi:Flp pilus assembly protein TadB
MNVNVKQKRLLYTSLVKDRGKKKASIRADRSIALRRRTTAKRRREQKDPRIIAAGDHHRVDHLYAYLAHHLAISIVALTVN